MTAKRWEVAPENFSAHFDPLTLNRVDASPRRASIQSPCPSMYAWFSSEAPLHTVLNTALVALLPALAELPIEPGLPLPAR
jgi:hypothetical protein